MRLVADVWVPGLPVTKGSVNVNRGGKGVRQAARGYATWSDTVRKALVAYKERQIDALDWWSPVRQNEGAMIRCRFWVPREPGIDVMYGDIWAPRVGDGDKLERTTWDAVTKAHLWQDDAQVVEWAGSRRWADIHRLPGVHIGVWALSADEIAKDVAPLRDSHAAYNRAMFPQMRVQR